ncbi:hypothetical protein B0T18DRAFT_431931 [Schizothecium vesticola]|uniref:Myb-like DNA-binding domain-containing protein n=1 Tax=Schizothecium vesticola TaxID=314040 RepID=A0AA40EJW6_9PEZI|nr:hypothetical protein B0T18DRAFT_431931 [Schizothecium vesticola]
MAPINDAEAQFRFLISCIKHSVAGKVDFQAVATELEIVTKAAAAKRYERLLKAHDASPRKAPADGSAGEDTPTKKARAPRKRGAAKISKAEPADDEDEDVKDEYKDDFSESEMKTKKKKGKGIASDELNGESALGGDAMSMLSLREIPWAPGSAGAVAVRGSEGGVVEIVDKDEI